MSNVSLSQESPCSNKGASLCYQLKSQVVHIDNDFPGEDKAHLRLEACHLFHTSQYLLKQLYM